MLSKVYECYKPAICLMLVTGMACISGCYPWEGPETQTPVRFNKYASVEEALKDAAKVQHVSLRRAGLKQFPSELAPLQNLVRLDLRGNDLGAIAPSMGSFKNLKFLDLGEAGIVSVPEEMAGATPFLETLYLDDNQLAGLPEKFAGWPNLKYLNLDRNKLTAVPPALGGMKSLKWLRLNGNQIEKLPPEIGSLTNLKRLYLARNKLAELPAEIGNLTELTDLVLSGNKLARVPESICKLTKLERLQLDGNNITTLPEGIGSLNKLLWLRLEGNPVSEETRQQIKERLPDSRVSF